MKMSVREARANFAAAIDAAERGEHVTITKNGKAVAEIGPPREPAVPEEGFWERNARIRKEMGLDKPLSRPLDDKWLEEFNDPAWTREIFGPEYFDDEPANE
ncbi:type II toxin-antitoxin system prevent-host-death family antitoxin [Sphingomonas sp. LB-2]|uniref:type II toxin-antitoxin system Phd/YefM family antitoxin n=1 Tax=Sphingomonas caeni TaxID=2984949 RepID=UPI002230CAB4|nr:type II toxin-antitoxin system prevent-host-death family antitoxin [Sphingomonas caeni]MCW3846249.1 type II toxin-antitoxin system prevent-host-death family antitoxin [Sphingomonas caeni]